MTKPEQIPKEVLAVFKDAWFNQGTLTTRECLAAAITLVRKETLEEAAKVAEGLYQQGQIGGDIAAAIRKLGTDSSVCTICPACGGNKWKAVKNPRLGPGVYETRCEKCNGHGWIEQEHETRP